MKIQGTPRQRIAYDMRQKGHTWVAIAEELGVGKERARQLARAFECNNSGYIRSGKLPPIQWTKRDTARPTK